MTVQLTPTRGALRVLRGVGPAVTSAALSVAAHTAAGGSLPDPGTTTVITALLAGTGVAMADRRRGPLGIFGALGASQAALHGFLELTANHQGHTAQPGIPLSPVGMLLGHLVAVLVVGVLLSGAENALFALVRLLRRVLPQVLRTPLPAQRPPGTRPAGRHVRPLVQLVHRRIHAPRGPPAAAAG